MNNKKLGVVGGMGPMATSMFFERVIERTVAHKDQEHLDMVILNHATMPDRTQAILSGQHEDFLTQIEKDLQLLEYAGVHHIAIPCNTSHFFMDDLKKMTSVPIINMVEETAQEVVTLFGKSKKVTIFATNGTIHSGIYERACRQMGLEFENPSVDIQEQVMKIIYEIKAGNFVDSEVFDQLIKSALERTQSSCVILACTELSILPLTATIESYTVDAMDVLIKKSILYSDKEYDDSRARYQLLALDPDNNK